MLDVSLKIKYAAVSQLAFDPKRFFSGLFDGVCAD
jgi:hypothetical protein